MGNRAKNVKAIVKTGIKIPARAKPFPVILPPDFSIIMKLIIPNIIEGMAVNMKVNMLRIPRIRAAIARLLVLHVIGFGGGFKMTPQELQDWASSGFWFPHFGQYIVYL